jgi:putative transposase
MLRAFRYRFYPSPEQESLLRRTIGCSRLVYNKALAERSEAWTRAKESVGYAQQDRALTRWKKTADLTFLNEVSSVPLQQALRHLQTAYTNFFQKRAAYPSFKKKAAGGSATFTRSAFRFDGRGLRLAKMEASLDIRWSRPLPKVADPSTVTVSLDAAGRWHVSILCEDLSIKPLKKSKTAIGIDLGISALATLSTGEKVSNPRYSDSEQSRKRLLAKALSRKQKGSKNRLKARLKLARLHARISDRRQDTMHKLSTRLVRENQVIVVEDLNVAGMMKNRCLSRVISDAAWRMLLTMLAYKCEWYGRNLIKVDRFFPSSKTCHGCGHVVESLPLSIRKWSCPKCGTTHDRDVNAALNILAAGHAVARESEVCGPGVSHRILRNQVRSGLKQKTPGVN